MTASRLTGLEFRWFRKGQDLASRNHLATDLELAPSVKVFMSDILAEVRESSDGPNSLRRIASRFDIDADALRADIVTSSPSFLSRTDAEHRITALRNLAAALEAAAAEMPSRGEFQSRHDSSPDPR